MLDILIKNCTVLDGSGKDAFKADVGVKDGRISALEQNLDAEALEVIDGGGLYLAPGFIDPHTHSDYTLVVDPKAESKIRQGVTTEVIGNCGMSPAPLLGASMEEAQAMAKQMDQEIDWVDMAGYVNKLNTNGIALNVVTLVGHNTVRGSVLG